MRKLGEALVPGNAALIVLVIRTSLDDEPNQSMVHAAGEPEHG
jgi:hypothetical protein